MPNITAPDFKAVREYVNQLKPSLWGRIFYRCISFRKPVVLDNLRRVFAGKLNDSEIEHLAKAFYSHMLTSIKEKLFMKWMSEKSLLNSIEIKGHEPIIELCKAHGGVIILTGHMGNWEYAPIAGIRKFKEFGGRFHIIRRNIRYKWLEKFTFKQYRKAGINVIPKDKALEPICEALEKEDAVVFVMDQHAVLGSEGIPVEFFGEKAGTYRSLAIIARMTGIPVVPTGCYRRKDGRHVMQFHPPLKWIQADKSHQEVYLNTRAYNQALEKMILAHPEQWFWMHRRWKLADG